MGVSLGGGEIIVHGVVFLNNSVSNIHVFEGFIIHCSCSHGSDDIIF